MSVNIENIKKLYELLNYTFKDKDLLLSAITHRSYANELSNNADFNERLEFLGDAALDLIIARHFFLLFPEADEGRLTQLRAHIVNEDELCKIARSYRLGDFLRLGKGEEEDGGRGKLSILADALEALIGALMLDAGYDRTEQIVLEWFKEEIQKATDEPIVQDYKSRLQEWVQESIKQTPSYKLIKVSGPPHEREFEMAALVNGEEWGRGSGFSKKQATQNAAKAAWLSKVSKD